jgi:hypothetical protein
MNSTTHHTDKTGSFARSLLRSGILVLGLAVICTGCTASKAYIDPKFRDADYLSIKASDSPRPVLVTATFQTNGKPNKQLHTLVRKKVTKVLAATRVFTEPANAQTNQAGRLEITVNNVANIGGAVGKGVGTGLTLGLAGSEVVDGYEMTAIYTPTGGSPVTKTYKHAIHTTIGVHSAPEGMEPVPSADAFDQVVEDMLLNFLRDLQKDGNL